MGILKRQKRFEVTLRITELVDGKPCCGLHEFELFAKNEQEAADRAWDIYLKQHPDAKSVLSESRVDGA